MAISDFNMIDTCPSHKRYTLPHMQLYKQLEPNEPSLEDSSTDHGPFSTLLPASLINKTLRHLFLSKGTAVGDSSPPQTHWLTSSLYKYISLFAQRQATVKFVLR